ncbi:MAG: hypothetical protein JJU45_04035 [Acidimicrobiia bacterium]|nr:hypothetical protein [Acidimicrobiia bacterium]
MSRISSLRRLTVERGLLGGHLGWLGLGAVLWGGYAVRRAWKRETGLAWRGTIEEGQTIVLQARSGRR